MFVAHRQQHRFGVIQIPAFFTVILEYPRFYNGIYGTRLFTEAAENTFCQIDIVSRRAARAIIAFSHFDLDRQCRTHCLAQLARDTAFLAVGIAAQRVLTPEAPVDLFLSCMSDFCDMEMNENMSPYYSLILKKRQENTAHVAYAALFEPFLASMSRLMTGILN